MQQTVTEAARLYGKARSTIHRAIESGRLSCSVRGDGVRVIDLAELIRLWGEPRHRPAETHQSATAQEDGTHQALIEELRALRRELGVLREEMAGLRALPAPEHHRNGPEGPQEPRKGQEPANDARGELHSLVDALRRSEKG